MIRNHNVMVIWMVLLVFSGCTPKESGSARFRVGQFLLSTQSATITFYSGEEEKKSLKLDYGQLSEYETIKAKVYFIKVWADGKLLLEKELGMGRNGSYTLFLTGIPEKNQSVNKESTTQKLHSIVEGSEGITANDYLPQLMVRNDFFTSEKNKGKLLAVHLMPGTVPLSVKLVNKDHKVQTTIFSYPKSSETKDVFPGTYDVELHFNGSPQTVSLGKLQVEKAMLYSLCIIPDSIQYLTNPELVIGTSKKRGPHE